MNNKIILLLALLLNSTGLLWSGIQNGLWSEWSVLLILNMVMIIAMQRSYRIILKDLFLNAGTTDLKSVSEFKKYLKDTANFITEVKHAISGITEIGSDTFIDIATNVSDESIQDSLLKANQNIIDLRQKEKESNWITKGVANIAELKQKGNNIEDYAYQVIFNIVKYLNANDKTG